jgi:Mg-chelatase subunit ChlD
LTEGAAESAATAALVLELEQLVRMASRRPELALFAGAPGCGWSFHWTLARVQVDPDDLRARAPDVCRGLCLHEAAHASVTRLHLILEPPALKRLLPLLNAIEDCRIETWLKERFPGSEPWIRAYNDVLFGEMRARPFQRARRSQYLRAVLERWWFGEVSAGLHPDVEVALRATREPIQRAIACQPPVSAEPASVVLAAQRAMWRIVEAHIMPHWDRLAERDRAEGLLAQGDEELDALLDWLGAHGHLLPDAEAEGAPRLGRAAARRAGRAGGRPGGAGPASAALSRSLHTDGTDAYLDAWRRVEGLTDHVADQLLRVFVARKRLRFSRNHATGTRLDLRRAMQLEADPRAFASLWMRPIPPERRDPALALLLDRSGSMGAHQRIEAAFDGLVLLVEATRRAGVPASVWSFADDSSQELATDAKLSGPTRRRLGQVRLQVGGGTKLAPALAAVRTELDAHHASDKVLFLLSDGEPTDAKATHEELGRLHACGIFVVGLGLGAETRGLREYVPSALVDVAVDQLVDRFAQLLLETLCR